MPRLLFVQVDHPAHPCRLTAQIKIVFPGTYAGRHQRAAVQLVGSSGADHDAGLGHHRVQRRRVRCVCHDQRSVPGGVDLVPGLGQTLA